MGWDYQTRPDNVKAHLDERYSFACVDWKTGQKTGTVNRVIRSAIVGLTTYYAAVEKTEADGTRSVWAGVALLSYTKRDGVPELGVKSMDESVGPCEVQCPEVILNLLTPTDLDRYGWRDRCRAYHAARKAKPKLSPGTVISFAEPIKLKGGTTFDRLEVVDPKRSTWRIPDTGGLFRAPWVKKLPFTLAA